MPKKIPKKIFISLMVFVGILFVFNAGIVLSAGLPANQPYTMLEPIPKVEYKASDNAFSGYLSGVLKLIISLAVVLAVLQLSRAGFEFMTRESFTGRSDAKKIVNNALFGLGLAFTAFLILNYINPDLVNIDLSLPKVAIKEYKTEKQHSHPANRLHHHASFPPGLRFFSECQPDGER